MSNDPLSRRQKRVQRALDFISTLGPGLKILDIGCQSGGFCAELDRLGHEPHGMEIVPELIENARRNNPKLDFRPGNCEEKIPFADGFFDVVWAGEVIEHIRHTDDFVNEINRVLKVGGHVLLSTPLHTRLKSVYIALFKFEKHFNPEFPHYRFYSKKSLRLVLEKRGFQVVHIDYIGRIPILANTFITGAKKIATKAVMSEDRF